MGNTAEEGYGLTQQEIIEAIRAGTQQFREGSAHGNPWLRLLRHEVESVVEAKHGRSELQIEKRRKELADFDAEARKIKQRLKAVERRRFELNAELGQS